MADGQEPGEIPVPTAEELKQEDEVLQDTPAEAVRASIIEKYGLTEDDSNKEFIDKLTADTLEQRKSLGKAIGQKRKYRDLATKAKPAEKPIPPVAVQQPDVDAIVNAKLEARDLESLEFPDNIKTEVQKLAKMQNISVLKAAQDPYIQHMVEEHKRAQKTDDAAISRTRNRGTQVKFDANNPPQVDMSTVEGRKTWDEYTKFLETIK